MSGMDGSVTAPSDGLGRQTDSRACWNGFDDLMKLTIYDRRRKEEMAVAASTDVATSATCVAPTARVASPKTRPSSALP